MAITYEWSVKSIKKDSNGTVIHVGWEKKGTDENGNSAIFNKVEQLDEGDPSSASYIQFDSLTEENVLGWIQAKVVGSYLLDVDHFIQRKIAEQVEEVQSTAVSLPWAEEEDLPPLP